MLKKIFNSIVDFYQSHILILSLLIGVIFTILGLSKITTYETINETFKVIGTVIISSGVFTAIVKSKQFLDIFTDELRNVVYCDEHLSNRKDIPNIWEKVSKHLYNDKFPEISSKIGDTLFNYFPVNSEHYYDDYKFTVDIDFDEDHKDYIILKETEEFTIKTHSTSNIEYKASSKFKFLYDDNGRSYYDLKELKINGIDQKDNLLVFENSRDNKNGVINVNIRQNLSGSKEYKIVKTENKRYSLKIENTKSHTAKWLFNKYTMEITYPENLEIKFYENGTDKKFTFNHRKTSNVNIIKVSTESIILPNQGTRLSLKLKNE